MFDQLTGLRWRWPAVVGTSAMIAIGAGVLVASAGGEPTDSRGDPQRPAPSMISRGIVDSVQNDQAQGFSLFARERNASDRMSVEARRQVGSSKISGRNLALSRGVQTPSGRGWAVPGNGTVCLVMPDRVDGYGVACSSTDFARKHGLIGMMNYGQRTELTMLAPRGTKVSVRQEDGSQRPLATTAEGTVSVVLDGDTSRMLEVSPPSGATTKTEIPPPPRPERKGAGTQDCGGGVIISASESCSADAGGS